VVAARVGRGQQYEREILHNVVRVAGVFGGGGRRAAACGGRRQRERESGESAGAAMATHHGVQPLSNDRGDPRVGGRLSVHLIRHNHGPGLYIWLVTHAGCIAAGVGGAFRRVCLFVCLSVCLSVSPRSERKTA